MSKINMRLLDSALSTHWAITEDALCALRDLYFQALDRTGGRITEEVFALLVEENEEIGHKLHLQSVDDLKMKEGRPMEGTHYVSVVDDVAVIQLVGPIYPRANMMTASGATSIAQFTKDFLMAFNDDKIKGIVIDADSPGGDVRGIGDAADIVYKAGQSGLKPINTFAEGYFCSACYYVGSAAQKIYGSKSSINGSIGVVLTASKNADGDIDIVSSNAENKRPDPSTDEGKQLFKRRVDALAAVFESDVQRYRGITEEFFLAHYGRGDVEIGANAVRLGLIDKISTLGEVVDITAREGSTYSPAKKKKEEAAHSAVLILKFSEEENMGLKELKEQFKAAVRGSESKAPDKSTPAQEPTEPAGVGITGTTEEGALTPERIAARRVELEEQFSDSAELFTEKLITGHLIYPAEQSHAASDFLIAKIDDAVYGGLVQFVSSEDEIVEGTREEAVRARYTSRPKHSLTQQAIAGIKKGEVVASVLSEEIVEKTTGLAVSKDEMSPERRAQLLGASDQGRVVLGKESQNGNGNK